MTTISREEVVLMNEERKTDINNMGTQMRNQELDVRDDFKSVWRAIDGMLLKIGAVVTVMTTIMTSVVMFIFKIMEASGAK